MDILLNMYDLIVMTKQPTGVNEGTMTAIDYIIINPQVWNSIVDIHDTGLSDHYAQLVYLECIYLLQKTWQNKIVKYTNILGFQIKKMLVI